MTDKQMREGFAAIAGLEQDMKSSGAFVLTARLAEAEAATVVRMSGDGLLTTDGPFVEAKEHLGGFYLIEADNLDTASSWAGRTAAIIGMPIEVRALFDWAEA
jgi:hypothetical protein